MGERQIFPVQTNKILVWRIGELYILGLFLKSE